MEKHIDINSFYRAYYTVAKFAPISWRQQSTGIIFKKHYGELLSASGVVIATVEDDEFDKICEDIVEIVNNQDFMMRTILGLQKATQDTQSFLDIKTWKNPEISADKRLAIYEKLKLDMEHALNPVFIVKGE